MIYRLVFCVAFIGCVVNGQIHTGGCNGLNWNTGKCNSITFKPSVYIPSINENNILKPASFNLTRICSSTKAAFKEVASCVLKSYRHCGDNDYKTLVLTEEAYKAAIDFACNNIRSIDRVRSCIGDSVTDCRRNREARESKTNNDTPEISQPFSSYREHFCARRQIAKECTETDEDFLACVDQEVQEPASIYFEYYSKMTPVACGATSIFIASSLLLVSLLSTFMKYL